MTNSAPEFRLSRLNIFLFDFKQAQRFAKYILRRKLHDVKNPYAVAKLVHLAFNTSLIVAYSRPFHQSSDGLHTKVSLRNAVTRILDTALEQTLHRKIIEMRDQAFAHSDAAAREIAGFNYDGSIVQIYKAALEPLTTDETQLLCKMIAKWIDHLKKQRSDLKEAMRSIMSRSKL